MDSAGVGSAPARKDSTTSSTSPATKATTLTPRLVSSWCRVCEIAPQIRVVMPRSFSRPGLREGAGVLMLSLRRETTTPSWIVRRRSSLLTSKTGEMRPCHVVRATVIVCAPP